MHPNPHKGAILLAALVFFAVTFALSTAFIAYGVSYAASVRTSSVSAQAHALADAGLERAIAASALDEGYGGETFQLGEGEIVVEVVAQGAERRILSTSYIPNQEDPQSTRQVSAMLEGGTGAIPFSYGVQAGDGGFLLSGGASVMGSVYANGTISALDGTAIAGSATAAGEGAGIGGEEYLSGVMIGSSSVGDAWASWVMGATVEGTIYCSTAEYTNKVCNTSRGTPPLRDLPVAASDIAVWKEAAEDGGTTTGDYTVGYLGDVLGPQKIDGDLRVEGGGTLVLTGPVWVTGDVMVSGGGGVRIAASSGSQSEVLLADGTIVLSGGAELSGSGQEGSVLFFASTASGAAISLSGGAGSVGLIAPNGTVSISGGTSVKTVAAREVRMSGGAQLTYDPALMSVSFSQGGEGGWRLKRGTYQVLRQ